jgi:hypothetical protein
MPIPVNPVKPTPGTFWQTLLMFFGFGAWLIGKGAKANSTTMQTVGAILFAAGIYFSIQWFLARRSDRRK